MSNTPENLTEQIGHYKLPFFLTLLGFLLYTIADSFCKYGLENGILLSVVMFFYGFFGVVSSLIYARTVKNYKLLKTRRPFLHILRGCIHFGCTAILFYSFAHAPMTDVYTLFFVAPIIITVMTVLWHGEEVRAGQWLAVFMCFAGTLIFLRPGFEKIDLITLMPLAAAFCYATSIMIIRHFKATEHNVTFNFTYGFVLMGLTLPVILYIQPEPNLQILVLTIIGAAIGMSTNLLVFWAHQNAPSVLVSPLQYTQLIWGSLIGFFLWGDMPDIFKITAMLLIAASGMYLIYSAQSRKATITDSAVKRP